MSKPRVIIDPQPRTVDLIFDARAQRRLSELADLRIFDTGPMPAEMLEEALPEAQIIIGQTDLPRERLERGGKLRAIFNVEGNFLPNIDYDYCFSRGIRVLIASPAFAVAVAEMALALALDLARGVSKNDRAFHERNEKYGFESNRDCSLFTGSRVGIIGFGDLARAFRPMLRPFRCPVKVYDPWLPEREILHNDCTPASLDEVLSTSDAVFVFASVTSENQGFLGARELLSHPAGRAFCAHEPGRSRRLRSANGRGQVGRPQSGDGCFSGGTLFEGPSDSGPSQRDSFRSPLRRNTGSLHGNW